MYRNRSSSHIVQTWQNEIEQSMEAGSSPILELGVSDVPTDDTLTLMATQRWCSRRTDISTPFLPGGGAGPLWLASMMRPLPRYVQAQAPEPLVVYSGVNGAEYLMTVAMLHAATKTRNPGTPAQSAIPVSYFTPQSQPGMTVSWDALPFFALNIAPKSPLAGTPDVTNTVDEVREDPVEDWLAWAGLLLALFLVLLAVLL